MKSPGVTPKRYRIEVRVTPEQDALIREAATLEHETLTSFVLDTVTARAATVIEQRRDITLSNDAFDSFMAALDVSAQPIPQLTDLFRHHAKLPEG